MDRRIELVIAKIKTDPASAWDFAALAVLVNLSPSRFRHLFKQETGTTPAQYLKEVRLRRAAKLLAPYFSADQADTKTGWVGFECPLCARLPKALRNDTHCLSPDHWPQRQTTPATKKETFSRSRQNLAVFDNKQSLTALTRDHRFHLPHQSR